MSAATTLDPAEAIAAAVRQLYDQCRGTGHTRRSTRQEPVACDLCLFAEDGSPGAAERSFGEDVRWPAMVKNEDVTTPFSKRHERHRKRAGMSRPVLAGLCGRSPEWALRRLVGYGGMVYNTHPSEHPGADRPRTRPGDAAMQRGHCRAC